MTDSSSASGAGLPKRNGRLTLEMLQGSWSPEESNAAKSLNRRMTIHKEKLTLSVADSNGHVRILASAQVKLCAANSPPTLLALEPEAEASSDTLVSI